MLTAVLFRGGDKGPRTEPSPGSPTTSRHDLARTVEAMTARLADDPGDTAAAVSLADALLRQARVENDPAHAIVAERALRRALANTPRDYAARRMLGAVLLSQHRFREAIVEATMTKAERPDDAWNDGVIGDAHIELGEYEEAFAAFDRMMAVRPNAAAYARVSYARELQGDREGARALMTMSLEATSAHDPESQAWHEVQLGHLAFESGELDEARRHFQRAEFLFPQYMPAAEGMVRVLASEGDLEKALTHAQQQLAAKQTSVLAIHAGDLCGRLGRREDAERHYQMAERLLRYEPAALAVFLADRDRDIPRALGLAETAAAARQDIFTADALAWTLFKSGRVKDALQATRQALRTGTRDRHLLAHAAVIHQANGDISTARGLAERALEGHHQFDLVGALEARLILSPRNRADARTTDRKTGRTRNLAS